jgi:hypothetical protein
MPQNMRGKRGILYYALSHVGLCIYACTHVCMYACMYVCMHVHMYAFMRVCIHELHVGGTCKCERCAQKMRGKIMHVHMYACMHVCIHELHVGELASAKGVHKICMYV